MNKVSTLYPAYVECNDSLGNFFNIHLLGFIPTKLDKLGQLPNLHIYEPSSKFQFFLRLEFVGDVEFTRKTLAKYDFQTVVEMYADLIVLFIKRAGINVPERSVISDVEFLIRNFVKTGVTHNYGWLYRGSSKSFIFEVGVVFFHVTEDEPHPQGFSVLVNGVRHQCYIMTAPNKATLDPWTLFEMNPNIFQQLEDWFNNAVNASPYIKAEFKIPR